MGNGTSSAETVWDAGNKQAGENAFHKRPLASLCHHSHTTPAPASQHPQPASRPAPRPSTALRAELTPGCPGLPGDCQNRISFLLLSTRGGKHLLRWGRRVNQNGPSPLQGFQEDTMEVVTCAFRVLCPFSHSWGLLHACLSQAWTPASLVCSPAGLHSVPLALLPR